MSKQRTILFVEGASAHIDMFRRLMARYQIEFRIAATATQAYEIVHEHRPALIILGQQLSDARGYDVCAQLRTLDALEQVPILMLVDHHAATQTKAYLQGADDCLTLPLNEEILMIKISGWLGRWSRYQSQKEEHTPEEELQAMALPTGTLVAGRYKVLGGLGQGSMGKVYRVHDQHLSTTLAMKIIDASEDDVPEEVIERFHREAMLMARVFHPHIVQARDYAP